MTDSESPPIRTAPLARLAPPPRGRTASPTPLAPRRPPARTCYQHALRRRTPASHTIGGSAIDGPFGIDHLVAPAPLPRRAPRARRARRDGPRVHAAGDDLPG